MEFYNIKKTYNGQIVLDIDKLVIEKNKIHAITGPNGSGKSTLARILAGLVNDDNNTIYFKGLNVGYASQKPYAFDMNLQKNILINGKDKNRCEDLIDRFNISYLKNKNAKSFSGGEQQKLALARFMMRDYDIVILDEPTSAMDKNSQEIAENIILDYVKDKTLIIITHDKSQINKVSNVTINMNNGKIV